MSRFRIRLEMGKNYDYPDGDSQCGYEFEAPLTATGLLDADEWKKDPDGYPVKRFWRNEPTEHGRLYYTQTGTWRFRYSEIGEPDDVTFQLNRKTFLKDEYVSIRDHAKEMRIFHITSVVSVEGPERESESLSYAD